MTSRASYSNEFGATPTFLVSCKMAIAPEDISDQLRRLTVPDSNVEFLRDQDLGRGAYGRVFKARYRGSVCAAKEIHSILVEYAKTPA